MPPLLLFISSLKGWWWLPRNNCAVVKDPSILVSAIMKTSILPLINSCKSLNVLFIELILRFSNIGFAGFSMQRFFNSWEKSWEHDRWLFLISFPIVCWDVFQWSSRDLKIFCESNCVSFLLGWSLLLFRQDSSVLLLSTKIRPLPKQ